MWRMSRLSISTDGFLAEPSSNGQMTSRRSGALSASAPPMATSSARSCGTLLFAALEGHLSPAVFEARGDWPTGDVGWFEAVRLGMR